MQPFLIKMGDSETGGIKGVIPSWELRIMQNAAFLMFLKYPSYFSPEDLIFFNDTAEILKIYEQKCKNSI